MSALFVICNLFPSSIFMVKFLPPPCFHPPALVGFGFGIRLRSSLIAITPLLLLHGLDLCLQDGDLPGLRTNLVAQAGDHQLCRHLNLIHCFCLLFVIDRT